MDSNETDERGPEPTQARIAYRLPITVEGDDAAGVPFTERTFVENVTRAGAFVVTGQSIAPGALLALHDADHYDRRLCYVQVVWARPDGEVPAGVGVKLVNDNTRWIDYLVARSARALEEDPPPVE